MGAWEVVCDSGAMRSAGDTGHPPTDALVVFDGHCGVCTRSVGLLHRIDRKARLTVAPFQAAGVLETAGVTREQAAAQVWFREGATLTGGAEAVSRMLDTALGIRFFAVLHHVPGVKQVQNWIYRWVAANRYRLPGTTPWCQTHECT